MGLISRVSSRTYRRSFFAFPPWLVKTNVTWERSELTNSSKSKRTRPTSNAFNQNSNVVRQERPITKHVKDCALSTRINSTRRNIVSLFDPPTETSSVKLLILE